MQQLLSAVFISTSLAMLSNAQGEISYHCMHGHNNAFKFCLSHNIHFIEIVQSPKSRVVFLGQPALFRCETDGDLSTWKINGIILDELPPDIYNDLGISGRNTEAGTRLKNLTIPGTVKYNETRVQCVSEVLDSLPAESQNVTLLIQGSSYIVL